MATQPTFTAIVGGINRLNAERAKDAAWTAIGEVKAPEVKRVSYASLPILPVKDAGAVIAALAGADGTRWQAMASICAALQSDTRRLDGIAGLSKKDAASKVRKAFEDEYGIKLEGKGTESSYLSILSRALAGGVKPTHDGRVKVREWVESEIAPKAPETAAQALARACKVFANWAPESFSACAAGDDVRHAFACLVASLGKQAARDLIDPPAMARTDAERTTTPEGNATLPPTPPRPQGLGLPRVKVDA